MAESGRKEEDYIVKDCSWARGTGGSSQTEQS